MIGKYNSMLLGSTLAMMVTSIVLISDSIISGLMLGSDAVVGVTLVVPICSLATFFASLTALGAPLLYNAEMGQFHKRDADRVFGMGLILSVGMGVVLFVLMSLFGAAYLKMSRPSAAVLDQALRYLHLMRFTMLLLPLQMLINSMVYVDGDETVSTVSSITQGIGNVAASLILSRFMGIEGVALGTILFYAVSLGILSVHFLKKSNSLRPRLFFSLKALINMVRYSAFYSGEYLFNSLLLLALSAFVGKYFGAEYLILVSVVNLCRVFQVLFEGVGTAISPIVSVYLGENCFTGVRNIYTVAERTARWESVAITAALLVFAPLTPVLLGISDPTLAALSIRGMRILCLSSYSVGMMYLSSAYYMLLNKTLPALQIVAAWNLVVSVPLTVVMSIWLGLNGFFIGMALAPLATHLVSIFFIHRHFGEDAPLLLKGLETGKEALLYDLTVSPSEITQTRDNIGKALEKRGYDRKTVNRVMLLFEEMFLLICEKNPGDEVQGECALILEDEAIRIIVRDTGVQFDLSDADMEVTSLNSYVISTVAERVTSCKQHLMTMSFNRNMFEVSGTRVPDPPHAETNP
jgi:Na+-driven multidrug efflux pump